MSVRKRFRWTQFSIKGILLATLLVAVFYSGRLSHQLEVKRAQTKGTFPIQSGKVKYINLGTSSDLRPGQDFNVFNIPIPSSESDIPDSIEQGMKASEWEMQKGF